MARRALVVEDEQDTGLLLAEHLRRWDFDPTVLPRGKPALDWVRRHKPELILLDLLLPDMHGFEICEILKLEKETNLIPIIMVTALSGDDDKVRGLKVGANHYLVKPFTADQLRRAIDWAFQWKDTVKKEGKHGEIRFQLQSDTKYLEELNSLLSALFLYSGLTEREANQLITAVREMGTNAIEWGHRNRVELIVTVDYHIDPEKVAIVIRDEGPGFDPANLPHAASTEDPVAHMMVREALGMREGGFGILMSKGLVDDLQYNEAGNEVRLIKFYGAKKEQGQGE